jgi:spermidine synthase
MLHIAELSESDAITTYPISTMIWSGSTKFCDSVVLADSPEYGRMLFLDGELQSATADERIYHETLVHPALCATAGISNKRVLVIGGGEGATVREVLRWSSSSVSEVVWVDIDTELVELCKEHLAWAPHVYDNPRVKFLGRDIKDLITETKGGLETALIAKFDVIILDLPDPDGDTGYLYSTAFWKDMKGLLRSSESRLVTHVGPVRPFGNLGEGLQRVWNGANIAGIDAWKYGFYQIIIPSFQGSWGFWLTGPGPFTTRRESICLPASLHVVDVEQMIQWALPPKVWRKALELIPTTVAFGVCTVFMPHVCACTVEYSDSE